MNRDKKRKQRRNKAAAERAGTASLPLAERPARDAQPHQEETRYRTLRARFDNMLWIDRALAVINDFTGKEANYADRFSLLRQNLAAQARADAQGEDGDDEAEPPDSDV